MKLDLDLSSTELFNFTSSKINFLIESSNLIFPFKDFVLISDDNFDIKVFKWDGILINIIDKVEAITPTEQKRIVIDEAFYIVDTCYFFIETQIFIK